MSTRAIRHPHRAWVRFHEMGYPSHSPSSEAEDRISAVMSSRVSRGSCTGELETSISCPSSLSSITTASMTAALCSPVVSPIWADVMSPSSARSRMREVIERSVSALLTKLMPSTPTSTRPTSSIVIAMNSLRRRASTGYPSSTSRR